MMTEPLAATLQVVDAFVTLGVGYYIVGSLASALHGVVRATLDADLVADLKPEHIEPLGKSLAASFHVNTPAMYDAVRRRDSFNVIHLETMAKVDVFILRNRPFSRSEFARRAVQVLSLDPEQKAFVATAEDTILAKLEWYRLGGEVSDRQWRDALGLIKIQRDRLDHDYLRRWAADLGLADLLERAWREAI